MQLTFSRTKIEDFLACERRFQLKYIEELPWPHPPIEAEGAARMAQGAIFHQLLERHFLRLPQDDLLREADAKVREWWRRFSVHGPKLQEDERPLPEMSLTLSLPSGHLLLGRFDLLVIGPKKVKIFDWKSGRPRSRADLAQDWQTRLYLALVAEGYAALDLPALTPEQITLTYWYAQAPEESVTLGYSAEAHATTLGEIEEVVAGVEANLARSHRDGKWPLTSDLATCALCAYRNFCGRFEAEALVAKVLAEAALEEREELERFAGELEPDTP